MQKLVYFGSAFNPPHIGHMLCMTWLLAQPNVAKVLAGPSKAHAFAKNMQNFETRCILTEKMIALTGLPVEVSRIENEIETHGNPVYTYDVLVALKSMYPEHSIVFGLGPDNVSQFERFYRYQDILNEFELAECPVMGLTRSTQIREAAAKGDIEFISSRTHAALAQEISILYK